MSYLYAEGDPEDVVERPVLGHGVHPGEGHPHRQAHQLGEREGQVDLSDERQLELRSASLGVLRATVTNGVRSRTALQPVTARESDIMPHRCNVV